MKKSLEQRALDACRSYAELIPLDRSLTRRIGYAWNSCPEIIAIRGSGGYIDYNGDWVASPSAERTRLNNHVYKWKHAKTTPEQRQQECPQCAITWGLLEQRRAARVKIGALKREIMLLGEKK